MLSDTTRFDGRELNTHQRAGIVAILMIEGEKLTTAEIARRIGVSWQAARYMMDALSVSLPLVQIDSRWQWIPPGCGSEKYPLDGYIER